MNDEIWTTRDGRQIAVKDMEESHVRAALCMVIRNARRRQERERAALLRDMVRILEHHNDHIRS